MKFFSNWAKSLNSAIANASGFQNSLARACAWIYLRCAALIAVAAEVALFIILHTVCGLSIFSQESSCLTIDPTLLYDRALTWSSGKRLKRSSTAMSLFTYILLLISKSGALAVEDLFNTAQLAKHYNKLPLKSLPGWMTLFWTVASFCFSPSCISAAFRISATFFWAKQNTSK